MILITCVSCTQNSQKGLLTKLTIENTLTRLKNRDFQFYYGAYIDSLGINLSEDLKMKLTGVQLKREFYVNKSDSIKEIRISVLKDDEDILNEIQLRSAMSFSIYIFHLKM